MHDTLRSPVPTIESGELVAPQAAAWRIENMAPTLSGTLRAVRGPCPYVPDYGAGFPAEYARMHGVYHCVLDNGTRDVLLLRSGDKLLVYRGWDQTWETLADGLSDEPNARFPDQWAEVGGKVIWTNGVDQPRIYDGYRLATLGYDRGPAAPVLRGPQPADTSADANSSELNPGVYRNSQGYSHPGHIGTPGDVLDGQNGAILASSHYGYLMWEDEFGNLSPASPASAPATLRTEDATNVCNKDFLLWNSERALGAFAVQLDDITRQFLWDGLTQGPEGTVALRLYRTPDTLHADNVARLLIRIPGFVELYPDNHPDAELGSPMPAVIAVPQFKLVTPYRGGVAVANTAADPGIIRKSQAGFCGTFLSKDWVRPDLNGAEVTGIYFYRDALYAWTRTAMFLITDGPEGLGAVVVAENCGLEAPSSLCTTDFGPLVWLGPDGWYAYTPGSEPRRISETEQVLFAQLNRARMAHACAVWSPESREYLCAVSEAGHRGNNLIWAWDGKGPRRRYYGIRFDAFTLTKDLRRLLLGAGERVRVGEDEPNVFVLDRETLNYEPPNKTYAFRSQWLRTDPTGRDRFNANAVYVGFVESSTAQLSWKVFVNGRRGTAHVVSTASSALTQVPPDVAATLDALVVGTGKAMRPRLFWKKFDFKASSVDSFAFDLYGDSEDGCFPEIASFAFDVTPTDQRGAAVSRG